LLRMTVQGSCGVGEPNMTAGFNCNCFICRLETSLTTELSADRSSENYHYVVDSSLVLSGFPTSLELIQHLHRPEIDHQYPSSDQILLELIRPRTNPSLQQSWNSILLLVFIPTIHRTTSQLSVSFPFLARDDIAQNLVTILLEFLHSNELQSRHSHLAFTVARRIRRTAFRWAIHESRIAAVEQPHGPPTARPEPEASEDHSPSAVLLREFLDNCERRGWLTSTERRILTESKIEGVSCQELSRRNGHSSVALQHRIQRLIDKLRRLTQKPPHDIPQQLELFPK
jgi:DNA-directed RNA polymerase specialized sigma24 family protein